MVKRKRATAPVTRSRKRRRTYRYRGRRFRRRYRLRRYRKRSSGSGKGVTGIYRHLSEYQSSVRVKRSLGNIVDLSSKTGGTAAAEIRGFEVAKLASIPNVAELATYYQFYKITGLKITIVPLANCWSYYSNTAIAAAAIVPWRLSSTSPATFEEVLKQAGAKLAIGSTVQRFIRPTVLEAGWETTTTFRVRKSGWYRTTDKDIPHYGFRYGVINLRPMGSGATESITPVQIVTTYYLKFAKQKFKDESV